MSVDAVLKRSDTLTVDGSSKGRAKINLRGWDAVVRKVLGFMGIAENHALDRTRSRK